MSLAHIRIFTDGANELPLGDIAGFSRDWNYRLPLTAERSGFDINVLENTPHWFKHTDRGFAHVCLYVKIKLPDVFMDVIEREACHQIFDDTDFTINGNLHFTDCYIEHDGLEFDLAQTISDFELSGYTQAFLRNRYAQINLQLEPLIASATLFSELLDTEDDPDIVVAQRSVLDQVLAWAVANQGARADRMLLLCQLSASLDPILRIAIPTQMPFEA